tara:strand:- start:1093 stop:1581 length:489 start_codon:yes stop_codon:yes gene_type:complete
MSGHKLNTNFTLYFHDPLSYNWTLDSYVKITDIKTIEDYWEINYLLREYLHLGMFFLMKDGISPLWDESNNNYSFSLKVLKNESLWYWNHINSYLLGGNFLNSEYNNNKDNTNTINGITISPKKNFCIIKIWLSEVLNDDVRLAYKIPDKYKGDIVIKKYNS